MFISDEGPTLKTLDFAFRLSAVYKPFIFRFLAYPVYIDGVGWRRLRCARRHARGDKLQRCRYGVGLLVTLISILWVKVNNGG